MTRPDPTRNSPSPLPPLKPPAPLRGAHRRRLAHLFFRRPPRAKPRRARAKDEMNMTSAFSEREEETGRP
ncbi:hypothetical protein NL676_009045 [Syzygium grande]|nr:hypothetical protein NL676_009045 [Syzygium grande]